MKEICGEKREIKYVKITKFEIFAIKTVKNCNLWNNLYMMVFIKKQKSVKVIW